MNENIDLTKILGDCPKGTKLYSPIFGEVKFEEINDNNKKGKFTIVVYAFNLHLFANFTKRGFYFEGTGECTLFPSKEQRDWSKFTAPWYKKEKIGPRFNVGDWVVRDNTIAQILDIQEQYYIGLDINGKNFVSSRFLNGNKIHLWTIQDAKDGDVLACNEEILLFKSYSALQGRISLYCWYNGHTNNFHNKEVIDILLTTRNKVCPATKEQHDTFMKVMKDTGYKWNVETKTLEKLVKPKFDPKTLKAFDKVLIRRSSENYNVWFPDFVSDPPNGTNNKTLCMCVMEDIVMVIPYNDETKHLLGTSDEAPEYYRYWED